MKDVRYEGHADTATITEEEFDKVGVSSADKTWSGHGDVQSVADDAADYLHAHDGRFTIVEESEQPDEGEAPEIPDSLAMTSLSNEGEGYEEEDEEEEA